MDLDRRKFLATLLAPLAAKASGAAPYSAMHVGIDPAAPGGEFSGISLFATNAPRNWDNRHVHDHLTLESLTAALKEFARQRDAVFCVPSSRLGELPINRSLET
jgi:hypothetical protein